MRKPLYLLILFAVSAPGCAGVRGHKFEQVSTWQTNEWTALQQLPELSRPTLRPNRLYRAVWPGRPAATVYLTCSDIEAVGQLGWWVWVFDDQCRLVQHDGLAARPDFSPAQLLAVSPLRVGFGRNSRVEEIEELSQ